MGLAEPKLGRGNGGSAGRADPHPVSYGFQACGPCGVPAVRRTGRGGGSGDSALRRRRQTAAAALLGPLRGDLRPVCSADGPVLRLVVGRSSAAGGDAGRAVRPDLAGSVDRLVCGGHAAAHSAGAGCRAVPPEMAGDLALPALCPAAVRRPALAAAVG